MCSGSIGRAELEVGLLDAVRSHGGLSALAAYALLREKGICLGHFCEATRSLGAKGVLRSSDPAHPIEEALASAGMLELGLESTGVELPPAGPAIRHLRRDIEVFLDRPLGRGSYGTVYVGQQGRSRRPVAVKILSLESLPSNSLRSWFVNHFRREPRIIASLHHPHIVQVLDWGEDGGDLWYAMELLEGGTLLDRIREEGRLSPAEVRRYFVAVAKALHEASLQGILHRDVKPKNIFNSGPKVADFGMAKSPPVGGDQDRPGAMTPMAAIVGTPAYIAPERADFQSGDLRSDIYSLGATMYHAATGRMLFNLDLSDRKKWYHHHRVEKPRPVFYSVPEFPVGLGDVIHRCLAKDPSDRFRTFESLLKQLEN
ncbi:MAG TPA: serine/threonine-protein kinase [Planctomycetota bacterium]|nr:serine/threonine-protein kinase [Planctomycetota bacterium]